MKVSSFRVVVFACLLAVVGALFAGCGGGGGGSSASFTYATDWTNRGRGGNTGLSQRVRLYDGEGRLLSSLIVNQDLAGLQQTLLSGVRGGTYRLFVELYSQRDLGGVKTGEVLSLVTVSGATVFTTGVGASASSVKVTPESATFKVQQSKQFYATAYASASRAVFSDVGGFTWQSFGGVATISNSGLALGTAQGSGTLRATHTASALQGGSAILVTPFVTTSTKWTVLVYLNAANDLFSFSTLNMNQMEQVAGNPDVRFIVQWKQSQSTFPLSSFDGTRRYQVTHDTSGSIASQLIQDMGSGVDMGSPTTLNDFITWGKTYFPAQRYVLVIWNHGNGWINRSPGSELPTRGVSYDDETGNYIRTHQLGAALGANVFDIVAWDASLMQMLEVAYEIKDQARFVAGSEESPPGEGYPYHLIFDNFRDAPDASTSSLSKAFVDGMLEVPQYASRKITQSVIDTSRLNPLAVALDDLAATLIANATAVAAGIPTVRTATQAYSQQANPPRYFRDLVDLCLNMEATLGVPAVSVAAAGVRSAVANAVIWEGHNANSPKSHGVSIDFSPATAFNSSGYALDYSNLRLGQDTRWDEWLGIAP